MYNITPTHKNNTRERPARYKNETSISIALLILGKRKNSKGNLMQMMMTMIYAEDSDTDSDDQGARNSRRGGLAHTAGHYDCHCPDCSFFR